MTQRKKLRPGADGGLIRWNQQEEGYHQPFLDFCERVIARQADTHPPFATPPLPPLLSLPCSPLRHQSPEHTFKICHSREHWGVHIGRLTRTRLTCFPHRLPLGAASMFPRKKPGM